MSDTDKPSIPSTSSVSIYKLSALLALIAIALAFFQPIRSHLSKLPPPLSTTTATSTLLSRTMATSTTTSTIHGPPRPPTLRIEKRPSSARGHADHDWLYTFHTFSFAAYHDPRFQSFGPLRVINEDRVRRGTGFGAHPHREALIWSYIVRGALEHKDSMGNVEVLRRGEVQFTSAGTGVRHSEFNRERDEDVHFLQIWATPYTRGLAPSYVTRVFGDELKEDRLCRIVEDVRRHSGRDEESEPIPLHADLSMSASILAPGKKVVHELVADGQRNVYLHVTMGGRTQPASGGMRIKVGDVELGEGDGAFIRGADKAVGLGKIEVQSVGDKPAEFLLFDMGME